MPHPPSCVRYTCDILKQPTLRIFLSGLSKVFKPALPLSFSLSLSLSLCEYKRLVSPVSVELNTLSHHNVYDGCIINSREFNEHSLPHPWLGYTESYYRPEPIMPVNELERDLARGRCTERRHHVRCCRIAWTVAVEREKRERRFGIRRRPW
jgi:hypothetical protein